MNIDTAFPSNYLKASDLGEAQPVVIISHLKMEAIGRDKEMKPVVYFKGKEKGLVLNKTNAKKIREMLGAETDGWIGGKIKLYATETEFGGETVECIRVKNPAAGAMSTKPKPEPEPDGDDDPVPF